MEGKRSKKDAPLTGRGGPMAVTVALVVLLATVGRAGASLTVVSETGSPKNRVNVVFLGDGYTADQIDTAYTQHIDSVLAHVFDAGEEPFGRYRNFFNIYRLDVVSAESGADVPPLGIYRDTALDGSYYYGGGPERLLYVNQAKANAALSAALSGSDITADVRWVVVNDTRYGGGGGGYAVFAGGNSYAGELALHETGHSFSDLADEYVDPSYGSAVYSGPEPYAANVTADPTGSKWSQWLGYVDSLGTVGTYEGAKYYQYGLYRPTPTSKMKALDQPFNAVSREKIVQDIYAQVHPLDAYLKVRGVLVDPAEVWVDVVDPNVIQIDWYVDEVLVTGAAGETFRLEDYGYGPGHYGVYADVYDPTEWVRLGRDDMEQFASWTIELTPEPAGVLLMMAGGGIVLLRRRRSSPAASATRT